MHAEASLYALLLASMPQPRSALIADAARAPGPLEPRRRPPPGWRASGRRHRQIAHDLGRQSPAVEAGLEMLRAGGSAADAAIAVQLVLNLVEPQSSGIGGGAFMLHWDAARSDAQAYDGRETAPAAAQARPLSGRRPAAAVRRRRASAASASACPGRCALLEAVHKQHGQLPWARLFAPAIRLAEEGFRVSPRLHLLLRWHGRDSFAPRGAALLLRPDGQRPARSATCSRTLSSPRPCAPSPSGGADAFYEGADRAGDRRGRARRRPIHPGDMTLADLAGYSVKEREPRLRRLSRATASAAWGRPPPAALAVAQIAEAARALRPGQGSGRRHERARAAPDRRGGEARLCRPRRATSAIPISCRPGRPARCRAISMRAAR